MLIIIQASNFPGGVFGLLNMYEMQGNVTYVFVNSEYLCSVRLNLCVCDKFT